MYGHLKITTDVTITSANTKVMIVMVTVMNYLESTINEMHYFKKVIEIMILKKLLSFCHIYESALRFTA